MSWRLEWRKVRDARWLGYRIWGEHSNGVPYFERGKHPLQPSTRSQSLTPDELSKTTFGEWAEKRERKIIADGPQTEHAGLTFAEFVPKFRELHYPNGPRGPLKASQIQSIESHWKHHIMPHLGEVEIAKLKPRQLVEIAASLSKPTTRQKNEEFVRKPKTIKNILTTLNTMIERAEEWGMAPNGLPRAKMFRVPKADLSFYDFDEFERLVVAAGRVGLDCLLIVMLAGRAGLRASELIGLAPSDIDTKRGEILVQRSETRGIVGPPKNGKSRRQPIPDDLLELLKKCPMVGRDRVFLRKDTSRLERAGKRSTGKKAELHFTIESIKSIVGRAEQRAGLAAEGKKAQIHKLRHTYASHLVMQGASLPAVQRLMDHSSIETTMRYVHLAPKGAEEAVALLNKRPIPVPQMFQSAA